MDTNLFQIKKIQAGEFEITLADENHAVFKAHFPSNPILPGFIFLHICEKALNTRITEVLKAKFISFAKPNDTLKLQMSEKSGARFEALFLRGCEKICLINFKGEQFEQ